MGKLIEVDEEQVLRDARLRERLGKIMAHPEAAVLAEKANKLVDPQAPTPVTDRTKVATEPVDQMRKEMSEFIAAQNKDREERTAQEKRDKLQSNINAGLSKLRSAGWTDEGIKGVEKIMEDKGILDPEDAALIFERQHPPQTPVKPGGTGAWNFMELPPEGDADLKKLIETKGESEQLADRMAYAALSEIRGASRR